MECKIVPIPLYWDRHKFTKGDRPLNRQGLPRRPCHPYIECFESQPLLGAIERLQPLPDALTISL
jgi:hypothetical protein